MPHWNEVFESVESYDSMTIEALQYSKIGKGASSSFPHLGVCHFGDARLTVKL